MAYARHVTQTTYNCTSSGVCKVQQTAKFAAFTDSAPKPVQGNFVTPTPYSRTITSWRLGSSRRYSYTTDDVPYVSSYTVNSSSINTGKQEVIIDTISKKDFNALLVESFQQNVLNLSMMAKDLYDASNMALDYFKRVNRCWKNLKRGNFRKAFKDFSGSRSLSKGMANNWLAFQYGVLPTIRSVQDGFAAANNQKAQTVRFVSTVSGERVIKYRSPNQYVNVYGTYRMKQSIRGFRYFTTTDSIRSLLVTNQVEVAWDATPYTFLLDWFVPIGSYLSQFGYATNLRANTGCNSTLSIVEESGASSGTDSKGRLVYINEEVSTKRVSFNRTLANNIIYRPSFSEVLNRSAVGLTANRCVNAFALLVQRIR